MKAMNGRIVAILLGLLLLTACGPDPRKDAAAFETRTIAQQTAANMELARQIEAQKEAERAAKAAYRQAVWDASLETAKSMGKFFVVVNLFTISLAVAFLIGSGAFTAHKTIDGVGKAIVMKAETQAALIHMDKSTRTFPVYVYKQLGGSVFMRNIATGETSRLDNPQGANPQLVAGLSQAMALGVAMQEMRGAKDASSMSVFQPEVIEMSDGKVLVGKMIGDSIRYLNGGQDE